MENSENKPQGIANPELNYTQDKQYVTVVANLIQKMKDDIKGASKASSELLDKEEENSRESDFYKGVDFGINIALTAIQSFQLDTKLYTDKDTDLIEFKEKQKK